jgi:hypothetical protein
VHADNENEMLYCVVCVDHKKGNVAAFRALFANGTTQQEEARPVERMVKIELNYIKILSLASCSSAEHAFGSVRNTPAAQGKNE